MMRIYLDNCCFNRPFDAQGSARVRVEAEAKICVQSDIRAKRVDLVWSYILDMENDANPFEERRMAIADWKAYAVDDVSESRELLACATALVSIGLRPMDALHVAGAIAGDCEYFLTTDDGILSRAAGIPDIIVVSPPEFLRRLEP